MAGARSSSRGSGSRGNAHRGSTRRYPRTARVNEVLREVIADELERIGDERLGLLTITGVDVDADFSRATVWVSALTVDGGVEAIHEALTEHRAELQASVARQVRLKRTPHLQFRSDPAITSGQRIESILRDLPRGPELDDDGRPIDDPSVPLTADALGTGPAADEPTRHEPTTGEA